MKSSKLFQEERRRKIHRLIDTQERVTVEDLVAEFGISPVTARVDLKELASMGAIVRSHGGAVKRLDPAQDSSLAVRDYPLAVKAALHHDEKVRIGRLAAKLIKPEERIILDSGTTTMEIARQIRAAAIRPLTVITNALNIAVEMSNLPQTSVVVIGGILRDTSYSLVGPQAEKTLRDLNADRLFLGVDGIDINGGLTTPDILEAQLNALMMKVAREVTVVADSSKFGRRSLSVINQIESIHRVITDSSIAPEIVAGLRNRGIEVMVA